MSARTRGSYEHHIRQIGPDHYRVSWTVDRKYSWSRLRFPVGFQRDTDEAGARRFAQKWKLSEEGAIRDERMAADRDSPDRRDEDLDVERAHAPPASEASVCCRVVVALGS